jgi:hypothetical protein
MSNTSLTEDQVKMYETVRGIQMKDRVTNWMIVAFFIILIYFMIPNDWQTKAITGILEGVLANSFYPIIKHYYPAYAAAKEAEKKSRPRKPRTNTPPASEQD